MKLSAAKSRRLRRAERMTLATARAYDRAATKYHAELVRLGREPDRAALRVAAGAYNAALAAMIAQAIAYAQLEANPSRPLRRRRAK